MFPQPHLAVTCHDSKNIRILRYMSCGPHGSLHIDLCRIFIRHHHRSLLCNFKDVNSKITGIGATDPSPVNWTTETPFKVLINACLSLVKSIEQIYLCGKSRMRRMPSQVVICNTKKETRQRTPAPTLVFQTYLPAVKSNNRRSPLS